MPFSNLLQIFQLHARLKSIWILEPLSSPWAAAYGFDPIGNQRSWATRLPIHWWYPSLTELLGAFRNIIRIDKIRHAHFVDPKVMRVVGLKQLACVIRCGVWDIPAKVPTTIMITTHVLLHSCLLISVQSPASNEYVPKKAILKPLPLLV